MLGRIHESNLSGCSVTHVPEGRRGKQFFPRICPKAPVKFLAID